MSNNRSVWNEDILKFVKNNVNSMSNEQIILELKTRFDLEVSKRSLSQRMWICKIRRDKRIISFSKSQRRRKKCVYCNSDNTYKNGVRYTKTLGNIQIYRCNSCGRKFSGNAGEIAEKASVDNVLKHKARDLIKSGGTTKEVSEKLNISKSTISRWCKGIVRRRKGPKVIYTADVVRFMRKCATDGLTLRETKAKCELQFQHGFSLFTFRYVASKHKILFNQFLKRSVPGITDEIHKFIKRYEKCDVYEIRDKIIEKFEKDIRVANIRKVLGIALKPKSKYKNINDDVHEPYDSNECGKSTLFNVDY